MILRSPLLRLGVTLVVAGRLVAAVPETAPEARGAPAAAQVVRGPRGRCQIALTFDMGAELGPLPDLLATLRKRRLQVTFFLTGRWAAANPQWVRQIAADGHEIGNHSWDHRHHTELSDAQIATELARAEAVIVRLTGRPPRPFWRVPFGEENPRVLRAVQRAGYRPVYWSLDSLDSVDEPKTVDFLVQRVLTRTNDELDGAIVLFHGGEPTTADAIKVLLPRLQRRGFQIVPVGRLFSPPAT